MNPQQILTSLIFDRQLPSLEAAQNLLVALLPVLQNEPNLLQVPAPLTIVGDLHGQFSDFLEMLKVTGIPPYTNYLFLGDFVDRGLQSLETVLTVFSAKLAFPNRVFLLRGNHETKQMGDFYGFYAECISRYNSVSIYNAFNEVFQFLPIAAVVGGKILAVHAGLSPMAETLTEIAEIEKGQENDVLTDLMWSDPDTRPGYGKSMRGAGYTFGQDVTESFLRENGLKLLVRGHQMVLDGYQWQHGKQVVTVFSAPNYCYRSGNKAAVMEIQEGIGYNFVQYGWEGQNGISGVTSRVPDYFM
ncbi:Serine/threonine-protein phosphatase [Spironucleus salmonicida]|uniref:Serine/threonine-protein phosphatase n=1 Tax=Spironucleus salmonicida TaxID=348837 RepID=V6LJI8_9EUKA|nr:Serine/threonine-protein phosphatase [Spironucleus salmonicida]|eukprot:EST44682.1 Serine/threonine-protein phosphatase [Spironucleus salmonicida]